MACGSFTRPGLRRSARAFALACCVVPLLTPTPTAAVAAAEDPWRDDLTPITRDEWTPARAAHLLERAGFGGTPDEVAALAALPPAQAVARLVRWQQQPNVPLPPFVPSNIFPSDDFVPPLEGDLPQVIVRAALLRGGLGVDLKWDFDGPWLQPIFDQVFYLLFANAAELNRVAHWEADRMLRTQRPLEEKMALFWHGHFATSNESVRDYRKMMAQWDLFRAEGNGSFRKLLVGIGRDPAMLIYLDGRKNVRGKPNENFARELMELFSMGVGNYTEADVKEAARAFTGWGLDGNEFDESWLRHDRGKKTFLGETGRFDGEDVVDIILEQPATAEFVVAKIYRYFVRDDPSPAVQRRLAGLLRARDYRIAPVLESLFLSRDFYSQATVGAHVKSPVELVVSTYRKLGVPELPGAPHFHTTTRGMGQALYEPPNVAGWSGGRTWINPSTLMLRQNFARHALFPQEIPPLDRSLMEIIVTLVVGENLFQQMQRAAATGARNAPPDMAGEESGFARVDIGGGGAFSLPWAVYNGAEKALGAIRFDSPGVARASVSAMLRAEGVEDAAGAVDHLTSRFLSVPARPGDRAALIQYFTARNGGARIDFGDERSERRLRELLHLVLSLPEYQVS